MTIIPMPFWVVLVVTAILMMSGCATVAPVLPPLGEPIPLHVLERDGIEIRLMDSPCVDEVSKQEIVASFHYRFKAIESYWPEPDGSRKAYAGCWTKLEKGEYGAEEDGFLVVFSDRKSGFIPASDFKKMKDGRGA